MKYILLLLTLLFTFYIARVLKALAVYLKYRYIYNKKIKQLNKVITDSEQFLFDSRKFRNELKHRHNKI